MNPITLKYRNIVSNLGNLKDLPLLFIRLALAYGFWVTGSVKWQNIEGVTKWFDSMGYPFPMLNAYLAATTEVAGVFLLAFGLGTRLISIPLMFVMVVAIATVHWGNGFNAGDNGFEIPLYYLLMLFVLLVYGSGKISIDHFIKKKTGYLSSIFPADQIEAAAWPSSPPSSLENQTPVLLHPRSNKLLFL